MVRSLCLILSAAGGLAAAPAKPHILFIVVDDHGWSDLGFTGRSRAKTPTIDIFARGGVHLTQAYVQKVCSPTRAAIMTGRYPHRNGMQTPFCGGTPEALNLNETLLPQYLSDVGYIPHAVGKWHLGFASWEHTPTFRGFSSFYGYYGCAEDYFTHSVPLYKADKGLDFHDDVRPHCGHGCSRPAWEAVADFTCYDKAEHDSHLCYPNSTSQRMCYACDDWEQYSTHLLAARASAVVAAHPASEPLFLYLALQDTHNPAEVPRLYLDRVDKSESTGIVDPVRQQLVAKLAIVDEAVANVTDAFRQNENMLANTLIIYTTDNGGPIVPSTGAKDDAIGASNWPLRGGKHTAHEGGIRATAFIWDGRNVVYPASSHGLTWDGLMHAVDWLPTLCSLVGCKPFPLQPGGKYGLALDGIDVSAALINNVSSPRCSVVLDVEEPTGVWADYGQGVVRIGAWKLHAGFPVNEKRPGDWSNHRPWENVTFSEPTTDHGPLQLFNVLEDPSERIDRINNTDVPDGVLEGLLKMLQAEQDVTVYPFKVGPGGHMNSEGVWEPWINETDLKHGQRSHIV